MEFGFIPDLWTIDVTFISRQVQVKYLAKKEDLYYAFLHVK